MSGYNKGISIFCHENVADEVTAYETIKNLSGESFNILTVLSDEDSRFLSVVLLRIDKERGQTSITVFPKNTLVRNYGNSITIENITEIEGDGGLIECIHAICGLTVDRYIVIKGEENITKVSNVIGRLDVRIVSSLPEIENHDVLLDILYDLLLSTNNTTVKTGIQYSLYKALYEKIFALDTDTLLQNLKQIVLYSDKTNLTFDDIDAQIQILTHYRYFTNTDGILNGKYRTVDNLEYFDVDCDATIEKFIPYRRKYN